MLLNCTGSWCADFERVSEQMTPHPVTTHLPQPCPSAHSRGSEMNAIKQT